MDDAAAPPPAAAPAGPLERLSDDELLAQCWSRGLAAGPDTPREAALRLLREALAWEELPPEALREAAARAAPSAATGGDRDALLRALADATWEAAGVPRRRFSSEALACRVLERVRALQAMGATQLLAEGRALGVASQPSMSPEALRSRLGAALVWSHLPGEELLRECEQRGVVLPSSVALGAHGAPEALFIAGSWSDWRVAKLKREGGPGHERFEHLVPIGPEGQESFQLLLEGDWDCTVYPSQPGAHPGMSYEILGPDRCGHGRNWTIGRHAADGARHGDQFLVGVSFEGDPREMRVSWAAASRAAGRGRSSASRFSYSGQPQAPQRSGRQLIVLRLLAQRDLVAGWEARGVPVDRFRGNLSAARALAEQYKLVDQTSTEDLSRWYYSNEGLPRERCITRGELLGLARRMALWELLPLEELRRERAAREEGPEACPDDGDERGALVDALFLHERRAAWEARGFPARRLGSTQATVQLVAECERFGEMDDAALHEALRDAGLPRGAELERARLLGALRALVCWQLLPLPELERDCLERGLPVPDACSDCEKERRAALVSLLRTDLLRSSYEASGIPVARLGVGRASVVVGQLASFGDMSLEQLRAAVEGERQFQAPRMSREELEGRLRKLLVWAALPTPELWAECGAVGIPLAGFERGDPEAGLRAQLLDRLELRERAAWAAAAASADLRLVLRLALLDPDLERLAPEQLQAVDAGQRGAGGGADVEGNLLVRHSRLQRGICNAGPCQKNTRNSTSMPSSIVMLAAVRRGTCATVHWTTTTTMDVVVVGGSSMDLSRRCGRNETGKSQTSSASTTTNIVRNPFSVTSGDERRGANHPSTSAAVFRYVQHMSDPLVSERVCRVRARRTPAGSALLPGAAREWPALEAALYVLSGGAFDPRREVRERSPVAALFSVTCPTSERRAHFHPLLYETFRTQDYEPKELVVVDTGLRPSEFFVKCARDDPRVVYRFFPVDDAREGCRPRGGRAAWTLGLKRNIACCLSPEEALAEAAAALLDVPAHVLAAQGTRDAAFSRVMQFVAIAAELPMSVALKRGTVIIDEVREMLDAGGAPAGAAEDAEARRLAPAAAKLAEWYLLDSRKAAREATQQPASAPRRASQSPAPWSDQYKQMQKQMEFLSAELKRVKAEKGVAAKGDGGDTMAKDPDGNETDYAKRAALQKRIDVLDQFIKQTKELDEDDPDLPAAKKRLDQLREEHRAMRPPVSAHKAAFQKLERCKSQKTKMEYEISELSARLSSLQNELDGKKAALEAKSKEVDLLEVEVEMSAAKLRKQRSPRGAEAAGVPEDFIKQLGSNLIRAEDAELEKLFKDLSVHPKFEKFQQIIFESVAPAGTVDDPMEGRRFPLGLPDVAGALSLNQDMRPRAIFPLREWLFSHVLKLVFDVLKLMVRLSLEFWSPTGRYMWWLMCQEVKCPGSYARCIKPKWVDVTYNGSDAEGMLEKRLTESLQRQLELDLAAKRGLPAGMRSSYDILRPFVREKYSKYTSYQKFLVQDLNPEEMVESACPEAQGDDQCLRAAQPSLFVSVRITSLVT
ncbi:unnamed protein product [Prorocentrum cordatum]|uniref:Uncharacterized protein n=2 Tax=Prorocentrum cordatum TaxID=2364126 RepID=A0ABN9TP36_9DINO|nr:unnamed protein product [Polarella glacialis]